MPPPAAVTSCRHQLPPPADQCAPSVAVAGISRGAGAGPLNGMHACRQASRQACLGAIQLPPPGPGPCRLYSLVKAAARPASTWPHGMPVACGSAAYYPYTGSSKNFVGASACWATPCGLQEDCMSASHLHCALVREPGCAHCASVSWPVRFLRGWRNAHLCPAASILGIHAKHTHRAFL